MGCEERWLFTSFRFGGYGSPPSRETRRALETLGGCSERRYSRVARCIPLAPESGGDGGERQAGGGAAAGGSRHQRHSRRLGLLGRVSEPLLSATSDLRIPPILTAAVPRSLESPTRPYTTYPLNIIQLPSHLNCRLEFLGLIVKLNPSVIQKIFRIKTFYCDSNIECLCVSKDCLDCKKLKAGSGRPRVASRRPVSFASVKHQVSTCSVCFLKIFAPYF